MGGAGGRGTELQKNMPRPGPSSGAGRGKGPGACRFWDPGGPVTNATPMIRRLPSALLFSSKPSPRSWKGLLLPASPPLPDTLASSTAIDAAPSLRSPLSTLVLPLWIQSVLYNARPSKSHLSSLTSREFLTMLMPTSFTLPYAPRGLIIILSPGSGPS